MKLDLYEINWHDLFVPAHPIETIIRGSLTYLTLFLLMRFLLKRESGSIGTADLLMVVVIADAAQNAMAGEYTSVSDGIILVGTLVFWNVALDWLAYRSVLVRRLVEPPVLPVVHEGKWIRRNLKRQWITTDEVQSKLRQHGIEDLAKVRSVTLEPDGNLSIIRYDGKD